MKRIKHIWKYLTSPEYRFWIDYCSQKENLDRTMNMIIDNLYLQTHPLFYTDGSEIKEFPTVENGTIQVGSLK